MNVHPGVLAPILALGTHASYRIADLRVPTEAESVEAVAINNRGEVLVRVPDYVAGKNAQGAAIYKGGHGYLWRAGRFIDLGDPGSSAFTGDQGSTEPKALNDRSIVVGGRGGLGPIFMSGLQDVDAFIWWGRGLEDLGTGHASEAKGINNLGDVAGGGNDRAFARLRGKLVWFPTVSHVVPSDPSGEGGDVNHAEAVAVNDRRAVLVNSTYGRSQKDGHVPERPFLVDEGSAAPGLKPLALPKGYVEATGIALGQDGTVLALAYRVGDSRTVPFLVRQGRVKVLGSTVPESRLSVSGLNAHHDVVGLLVKSPYPLETEPRLWLHGQQVSFPRFAGWTLQTATGINDKGEICGTGLHDGKKRAYVLIPIAPASRRAAGRRAAEPRGAPRQAA